MSQSKAIPLRGVSFQHIHWVPSWRQRKVRWCLVTDAHIVIPANVSHARMLPKDISSLGIYS